VQRAQAEVQQGSKAQSANDAEITAIKDQLAARDLAWDSIEEQ
jgi:hypothetical protein